MYAVCIWEIIFLWHQSRMGNLQIPPDHRTAADQPDYNGCGRIIIHRISHIDRGGNHLPVHFPGLILAYPVNTSQRKSSSL